MLNSGYMLVSPFFTEIAKEKDVDEFIVGIIIAAFPLGGFVSALYIGRYILYLLINIFYNIYFRSINENNR
jgi:hypothetical protein